jgi:hypothetical protein
MKSRRNYNLLSDHKLKYILAVIAIAMTILLLEITNTTHLFHKSKVPAVIPVTPNTSQVDNQNGNGTSPSTVTNKGSSSNNESDGDNNSSTSSLPLKEPFGDFVSNHHPNLSGSPAPSEEASVCNTTPGATCYIKFTQGSVTTKLPAQKTDSSGAAYWSWDVKKAGLTKGDWYIEAVATLNGQTKSTKDQLNLSISK